MTTFVEKIIDNELPTSGFKPFVSQRELLREERDPKILKTLLKPTVRGFFQQNWKHGNQLQDGGKSFFVEFTDRLKIGNFGLRRKIICKNLLRDIAQFILQNGNKVLYRASVALDLGKYGELEFTQQAKNNRVADQYELNYYNSFGGTNTKASLLFRGPESIPEFHLSSLYNQTMEVIDRYIEFLIEIILERKTKKLNTRSIIYGVDTSFTISPLLQNNYSLFYQSKQQNFDLIAAYLLVSMRKAMEKKYSNLIVGGLKYRTLDNKKILGKLTYNIEDKLPQFDLMIRNRYGQDKRIKTFHKISSNMTAGSGFTLTLRQLRLHGLAEVNFMKSDYNCQPFNLSFRVEMNDNKTPVKK